MAKFTKSSKLSKDEQEKLWIYFCRAIVQLKKPVEAAQFLKDILSVQEAEMLAKRLKVAEMLLEGSTYSDISAALKTSPITIARVSEWLKLSGEGYRLVLKRMPEDKLSGDGFEESIDPLSWRNIKKRYPIYFWPQLLLEEIVKNAKKEEKERLRRVLKKMDRKQGVFKRLDKLLSQGVLKRRG